MTRKKVRIDEEGDCTECGGPAPLGVDRHGMCLSCAASAAYRSRPENTPWWAKAPEASRILPKVLVFYGVDLRLRRELRKSLLEMAATGDLEGSAVVLVNEKKTKIGIILGKWGLDLYTTEDQDQLSAELVTSLHLEGIKEAI